jgi:hypothetical protein
MMGDGNRESGIEFRMSNGSRLPTADCRTPQIPHKCPRLNSGMLRYARTAQRPALDAPAPTLGTI